MKHTYTEEEKEKIAQTLFDFLREHKCFGWEHFAQNDECQIDSIDFMCDLADIKDVTERDSMKMWISRNVAGGLKLSINKPTLTEQGWWNAEDDTFFHINSKYFPEVTFENSPMEVELVIKK